MNRKTRAAIGVCSVLALSALGACGDDEGATDSTGGGNTTVDSVPTSDVETVPTDSATTTALASENTEPSETKEPFKIGFVNLEGGAISLPEFRMGAEAAAKYVNETLGGVNGRMIEIVRCDTDGSPEKSIDCANRFAEEAVDVVQPGIDIGLDAALPILQDAGIPIIGHSPFSRAQQESPSAYFLGSNFLASTVAPLKFFADGGATSVTYFFFDTAEGRDLIEQSAVPTAEALGIEFNAVYYNPASPDWNALTAAAMVGNPDVIGSPAATEPDCIGFVTALRAAGFTGRILAGNCSAFVGAVGAGAEGVVTTTDLWNPADPDSAPPAKQQEITTYVSAMEAAGYGDNALSFAAFSFSTMVDLAKILGTVDGPIDSASVREAFDNTIEYDTFMGATVSCGGTAQAGLNVCGTGLLVYEVASDGHQRAAVEDFIDLSSITGAG